MPLPRKVILLLLDSLPLGELGCYGGFGEKTPGFDRLAAQGAVFENAYTPVVTDGGSAFEERGPWSAGWHAFAANLRRAECPLEEIVCTTLAALTEAVSSERVEAFLSRAERGVLVISGPELVPPPVHGHLSVVDEAVDTLLAAIESVDAVETMFIVGSLQGTIVATHDAAEENEGDSDETDDEDRRDRMGEPADASFPRLVARRVNIPLLLWTPKPVVPGMRVQALVTTSDIIATLGCWLSPDDRKSLDAERAGLGGLDLRPVVDCLEETIRNEILIRGPGEIALRTLDRYVVIRLNETEETLNADEESDHRSERSTSSGRDGDGNDDRRDSAPDTVAVFRKPQDVWDRLDVGNTMPEERDMLVQRCRTLFAEAAN